MIRPEHVYLAVEPVDMRWGIERLSCHVQHAIGRTPCDGSAYAFTNRKRPAAKVDTPLAFVPVARLALLPASNS